MGKMTDTKDDWLWFCAIQGLSMAEQKCLLQLFGGPAGIRSASQEAFGLWERLGREWVRKVYPLLRENDPQDSFLERTKQTMAKSGIRFACRHDRQFPDRLKKLPDCPYGLFYKGRLPDALKPAAAVIGARACSAYGALAARQAGESLARAGIPVVSGMAAGIDGISQAACLEAGGESFAVLGCGPDICYPRSNIDLYEKLKTRGGIISELPPAVPPLRHHFPQRNRIISGLADVLVVVEAREKSGTLITAGFALDQGKDVFAMPGRCTDDLSRGCNSLIADGAGVILDARETADAIAGSLPVRTGNGKDQTLLPDGTSYHKELMLAPEDELVYSNLDLSPLALEQIAEAAGMDARRAALAVFSLQMQGLVREVAKNMYVRT